MRELFESILEKYAKGLPPGELPMGFNGLVEEEEGITTLEVKDIFNCPVLISRTSKGLLIAHLPFQTENSEDIEKLWANQEIGDEVHFFSRQGTGRMWHVLRKIPLLEKLAQGKFHVHELPIYATGQYQVKIVKDKYQYTVTFSEEGDETNAVTVSIF